MYTLALLTFLEVFPLPWVPQEWESRMQIERLSDWLLWLDDQRGLHGWCDGYWDALEEEFRWRQDWYSAAEAYRFHTTGREWRLALFYRLCALARDGQRRGWCIGLVPPTIPAVPQPSPMGKAG